MRYTKRQQMIERNARLRAKHALRRDEHARRERERRDAIKRRMISYLGGACTRCERTLEDFGHPAALEFHHRDWRLKKFHFSGNYGRRWSVLRAELDKCVLVCACCHRIIEATEPDPGRRRGRPPHPVPAETAPKRDEIRWRIERNAVREVLRKAVGEAARVRAQLSLFDRVA